jgi:hypothetical protein
VQVLQKSNGATLNTNFIQTKYNNKFNMNTKINTTKIEPTTSYIQKEKNKTQQGEPESCTQTLKNKG